MLMLLWSRYLGFYGFEMNGQMKKRIKFFRNAILTADSVNKMKITFDLPSTICRANRNSEPPTPHPQDLSPLSIAM